MANPIRFEIANRPSRHEIIPAMDWDRAPWNRWSFLHMREVLPTVEVWRGRGPVRQFERSERPLNALPVKSDGGRDCTLSEFLAETYTDGFLVVHRGKIVFENYLSSMEPRTLFLSQSVAKSVVGMTAGILIGQGLLDPKNLVTHYLPELVHTGWKAATLRQVLDMTAGVKFDETYTNPHSDMGQLDVACGWKSIPPDSDKNLKWSSHVREQIVGLKDQSRPHGEAFEYRSIETDVLAFCMERVTGKRLAQLSRRSFGRSLAWKKAPALR